MKTKDIDYIKKSWEAGKTVNEICKHSGLRASEVHMVIDNMQDNTEEETNDLVCYTGEKDKEGLWKEQEYTVTKQELRKIINYDYSSFKDVLEKKIFLNGTADWFAIKNVYESSYNNYLKYKKEYNGNKEQYHNCLSEMEKAALSVRGAIENKDNWFEDGLTDKLILNILKAEFLMYATAPYLMAMHNVPQHITLCVLYYYYYNVLSPDEYVDKSVVTEECPF